MPLPSPSPPLEGTKKKNKEMTEGHVKKDPFKILGDIRAYFFLLSEYTVSPQHTNEFQSETEFVSPICP